MSKTLYSLFYRFTDGKIETTHYSVQAIEHARSQGWEYLGTEPEPPEDIEALRLEEEHKWDRTLKERR